MQQKEPPRAYSKGERRLIAAEIALPGMGWGTRGHAVGWLAPARDHGTLILTWLGDSGCAPLPVGSRNAGRANDAASLLRAREVTLRGSSIQLAPNLPFGCPGDESGGGLSTDSSGKLECNVPGDSVLQAGDAVAGRYGDECFHVGSARRGEGRGSAPRPESRVQPLSGRALPAGSGF